MQVPGELFADAVDALERCIDDLGDEVGGAVVGFLREVRAGSLDRVAAGLAARALLLHIGASVDVATVEPLVVLLGAIAEQPGPDPELPIEVALADPGARGALRRAVFAGTLFLPVLDVGTEGSQVSIQFVPIVARGCPLISAFTSRERLGDIPHLEVDGHELAALCPPGHGLIINPGCSLGAALDEVEVRCLPSAPTVGIRDGQVDLRPLGPDDDDLRAVLADVGSGHLAAARQVGESDDVVVVAVDVDRDGSTPEQAIRRVGVALAERGVVGPLLVPATSPLGAAVVAATGSRR